MSRNTAGQIRAVSLAAVLVGWSLPAGTSQPWCRHPVTQAALGTALAVSARAPLGLRPPQVWSGLRVGAASAFSVAAGVAASAALPLVRDAMAARTLPDSAWRWGLVDIPVGTVWSEEAAFRGALATAAATAFGPVGGRLLQSAAFGLSHIADARATGEPVLGTVLMTGAAGWLFDWLRARTGSLAAPLLAHLVVNEAGAVTALLVQRRVRSRRRTIAA